eukprot:jgi/Tetstr1/461004/TSEL_006154.t1
MLSAWEQSSKYKEKRAEGGDDGLFGTVADWSAGWLFVHTPGNARFCCYATNIRTPVHHVKLGRPQSEWRAPVPGGGVGRGDRGVLEPHWSAHIGAA